LTPWVARLLFANAGVFLLTSVAPPELYRRLLSSLSLVPGLLLARPWTVVTYMFLHADFWHLLFNMIALFFFGPRLEVRLGSKSFLVLYAVAGLAAALLSWVFTPAARIIGASGAVFGVLLGFARYYPRERIFIWGVLPIESRVLVGIMAAFALFFGFSGGQGGIAHFAHLGGFLGGWVYLAARDRRLGRKSGLASLARKLPGGEGGKPDRARLERWKRIDAAELHEVNREHLEELRRKIEEEGPGRLTDRERAFLDRLAPDD